MPLTPPKKPMPSLRSDAQAEAFVEQADLSTYDLSAFKPMKPDIVAKQTDPHQHLLTSLLNTMQTKATPPTPHTQATHKGH